MAIFNSYVSLPEGAGNEMEVLIGKSSANPSMDGFPS